MHFLQKYVVNFCRGMFLLVLRIEFSKGFRDICTKHINLFTFLRTRAHSKLTMNLGLTIVTHGFFPKKGGSQGWTFFREIPWGGPWRPAKRPESLLRSCCSCGGLKKRECRGGTTVRVVCWLSLNRVGFPPKNRKTNKDKLDICNIHTQISICIYVYIYIYTHILP